MLEPNNCRLPVENSLTPWSTAAVIIEAVGEKCPLKSTRLPYWNHLTSEVETLSGVPSRPQRTTGNTRNTYRQIKKELKGMKWRNQQSHTHEPCLLQSSWVLDNRISLLLLPVRQSIKPVESIQYASIHIGPCLWLHWTLLWSWELFSISKAPTVWINGKILANRLMRHSLRHPKQVMLLQPSTSWIKYDKLVTRWKHFHRSRNWKTSTSASVAFDLLTCTTW